MKQRSLAILALVVATALAGCVPPSGPGGQPSADASAAPDESRPASAPPATPGGGYPDY